MKLYSYWRSSTSYRVRIALHLKDIPFETIPVNLIAGEQAQPEYLAINPVAGVPSLILESGETLTQSMAILDYLDAAYPMPSLVPADPIDAANVRAAAMVVACEIHPVNNLKIGAKLKEMGHSQDDFVAWMNEWMTRGLSAFQALLPRETPFCFGDAPGLADLCLVPQLYNAQRWGCDLSGFTRLTEIETRCLALPAFDAARPENQPDAA